MQHRWIILPKFIWQDVMPGVSCDRHRTLKRVQWYHMPNQGSKHWEGNVVWSWFLQVSLYEDMSIDDIFQRQWHEGCRRPHCKPTGYSSCSSRKSGDINSARLETLEAMDDGIHKSVHNSVESPAGGKGWEKLVRVNHRRAFNVFKWGCQSDATLIEKTLLVLTAKLEIKRIF